MSTSSPTQSPILVAGSTGTVGQPLVRHLVDRGEPVRAGTRTPGRYDGPREATPVRLDLADPDTWEAALQGVRRAFVLSPSAPSAQAQMGRFVAAAADAGVRRIVVMTAMGVDQAPDDAPLRRAELAAEKSAAKSVVLRPNWFMQNFLTFWRDMIETDGVLRLPAGDGATSFVDAIDIARVAATALTDASLAGTAHTLTGPSAHTHAEAAEILSNAWNRPIRYEPVGDVEAIDLFRAAGLDQQYAEMLVGLFESVRAGYTAPVSPAVEEVTGRPPRSLRAFAKSTARVMA
jgi:uncharacterized protein YbjT (DUF2867 family)